MNEPEKIIEWRSDGNSAPQMHLHRDVLQSVLSQTAGKKLRVVSIVGPFRTGKSFLMSLIVRYLEYLEKEPGEGGNVEWMFTNEPLKGFYFENSIDLVTSGVQIWPKPFFIGGNALILLDTPGIFESDTSLREWAGIAGTSLLLSSCTIFNVAQNLQEDSLIALQTFLEYAKLVRETDQGSEHVAKPCQEVLFLIRDWNNPEFKFGEGNKFLQKKMEICPGMSAESGKCREFLKSNVDQMDCFLMPHPEDSEMEFGQPLNSECIEATFAETLKQFVVSFLEPSKIKPKLHQGNPITIDEFLDMAESYIKTFNSNFNVAIDVTNVSSIMRLEAGVIQRVQEYKSIIERKLKKKSTPKQSHLDKHHSPLKGKLLQEFKEKSKCDPKTIDQFLVKLNDRVDLEYEKFSKLIIQNQQFLGKEAEKDVLSQLTAQMEKLTISEQASNTAFEAVWSRAQSAAKESYQTKIAKLDKPVINNFLQKIQEELIQLYENTKKKNQSKIESILKKNEPVLDGAVEIYTEKIELLNSDAKFILPEKLVSMHKTATKAAITLFDAQVSIPPDGHYVREILSKNLKEKLNIKYEELQQKNSQAFDTAKGSLQQKRNHMLNLFEEKLENILNSNWSLNMLKEQFEQAQFDVLSVMQTDARSFEVQEKSFLDEFIHETTSKIDEIYSKALENLEARIREQLAKEDDVVNLCASNYFKHLESLEQTVCTPGEVAAFILQEKQSVIDNCNQQLQALQSAHIPDCIEKLTLKIDSISEDFAKACQSRYNTLQDQLQKFQDDTIAFFQRKISLMTISLSDFTQEELEARLKTAEESSQRNFSSNPLIERAPVIETDKFAHQLQEKIKLLSQQQISDWKASVQRTTEELKIKENEEATNLISRLMRELSKYSILNEEHFREKFDNAQQGHVSAVLNKLKYKKLPHSCIEEILSTVKETLTSLEHKHWADILKTNRENEDILMSRISDLKTQYFKEVVANMESRNDIASRLTSTFVKEFTYSSRKDEDWWQLELEKELLAINDQIDSNEEHALEVEQRKKELMQNFVSKATDSESINEDGLDELIESYTISFSKSTNNENIVKNFRQDLQREKARILRKKQEDLQVAQLEKVLDQLLNEYRSLLQKNGSSQNNKMKQQTLQKLEMLARRLQIDHYEYQARLISSMESILEEYQELEKSHMTEEKIKTIVEQVNKIYHEEMSRHFATPKYYSLQDMTDFHSDATREAITKVPGARADEEDIRNRIHNSLNESFKEFDNKNAMNVPTSFAIGIDLGTTYCCVGVFKNGQVEVIKNELGKKTTPSYVYYSIEGDVVVGETAKNQSHSNPERTIYEVKRLIGRDINDPAIQSDIAKWPFQVVSERGIAKVHVGEVTYFPEEVSAQILAKLKQVSEEYLNQKVTHAVITVPAYFTDGQKAATKRAGEEAGLEILRIISEPTAAAIAYNLNWTEGSQPTKGLVYDLGGGTFDVALFTAKKGDIKIVNVGGDTHLGGVDFDNELVLHCCHEFQKLTGVNLLANQESKNLLQKAAVNRKLMRLKRSCEQYKKDLSTAEIITVAIDNIHENQDLRIKVSRVQFERMIDTYIDKSLEVVDKVLKEAQTKKDDVEEIVLIGGSTRIPRIQNRLMEFFGTAINKKIDPDEAVAVGAAYEAAVLNGRRAEAKGVIIGPEFAPRGFSVLDITPMAYGIEIDGGDMCILIPKQSQVPIEVSRNFLTSYHHQTSVQIVIYEGENPKARDNTLVGEFYLNGIPPALAGEHNVQVTMKVSPEGMINVAATCIANGIRKELTVRANKRSMGRRERIRQTA